MTPEIIDFIRDHEREDGNALLLSAAKYPGVDVRFAVEQIIARRQIKEKLPSWYANRALQFPSRISTEQCSSEVTAAYKARLIRGTSLCDLTGGLGVDTYFFSQQVEHVIYVERFPEYCEVARVNFQTLGVENIEIRNMDATTAAGSLSTNTFYLDPARRAGDKRVFALADCEPDVLQLKPLLLARGQRLIVKVSPMADIQETLRLLPETTGVHVLSVKNECKELLFVLDKTGGEGKMKVHAVHFTPQGEQHFSFTPGEEQEATPRWTDTVGTYLYEPNSSLLKGGAFKLVATRYGIGKLHRHSHLYTSSELVEHFPGRTFHVKGVFHFSGKFLNHLSRVYPQANITTRNFPLTVAEIRSRSGIKEGGDTYLFATTLTGEQSVIIETKRV